MNSQQSWNTSQPWGTLTFAEEGLFRVRLKNPEGSLMINTWFLRTDAHLTVIDPGWPWTYEGLKAALSHMGWGLDDVDTWLYTHSHVDHMGLAARLSRDTNGRHVAYHGVSEHLGNWHAYLDSYDWAAWAQYAFPQPRPGGGLPQETRDELFSVLKRHTRAGIEERFGSLAVPELEAVDFGDWVDVGVKFQVLDARGHDPYHVAFWEPERAWLFSGDLVLATPTPLSRAMNDDLSLYLKSLDSLQELPTAWLFPGHGVQKSNCVADHFERSRQHQMNYRALALKSLENGPKDLYTMATESMSATLFERFWVHAALLDTHLQALSREGEVNVDDAIYFL